MLFKKTICHKCKASYDECLANCPICQQENRDRNPLLAKDKGLWFRWEMQLGLFFLGTIGFIIFTVMVGMFTTPIENIPLKLLLGNGISYFIVFTIMTILMILNRKTVVRSLKDYRSYVWGILLGGVLLGSSILLDLFIGIWHKVPPGGNQSAIVQLVLNYPVASFVIICIFGPVCEEIAYRVGLFSFMKRINKILAFAVTILLFTAVHLDYFSENFIDELWNVPGYALGAFALTFAYEFKGFGASTTCHIVNNLVSYISILVLNSVH